ncbi:GMC family oxidoreductase [Mesorhizobium sp. M0751]|uniref:GMC family oxidoreductase n=2 Tax=Mesorhizobium TaxID=68287 RepID=UPI00333D01FD
MATKLNAVDVLIVGLGWTGGIIAKELASTKLKIVSLERGGPRDTNPDFIDPQIHDELRYAARHDLMQNVRRETITFRNSEAQTALPMRQLGSFLPGQGVGGAGVHWNGVTWRWLEWDHQARARTIEKYGEKIISSDMQLQDWPITYDDLEPYYDKFEKTCGTSGKAGNINGRKIDGGNIFEGSRKHEYPNPPMIAAQSMVMFEKAARNLGYHPFPNPSSNASRDYVNPDGVAFGQCHYCGFCERFGCEANAKASPHFTVIPLALENPNFELRTNSIVLKVNLDSTRKKAVSVTYLDARGREFEQPADLIILSAYALGNVNLLLQSGIGVPYDPATGKGVVGRNYAYQCGGGATAFFDKKTILNRFMGAGALGTCMDDFNGDNYDFEKAGYIGGGGISCSNSGARPIQSHPTPRGTPRWGSDWKEAVVDNYDHAASIGNQGAVMAYRQNYLSLDPTYTDVFGRPLMRMTFDFQDNEVKQMNAQADICVTIAKEMGATKVDRSIPPVPYSIVPYQSTHNTGGAVFGADPSTSVLNKYLQVWDVPNVFVTGACVFPQNAGKNPTGPVGALAYWAVDAIKNQYLKSPGPLVPS